MNEVLGYTMIPIQREDVIKDKDISWIIKPELLEATNIYLVSTYNNNDNRDNIGYDNKKNKRYGYCNSFSGQEIKTIRKFNRDNEFKQQFVFNLNVDRMFFIEHITQLPIITNFIYNDKILEYGYGKREEEERITN